MRYTNVTHLCFCTQHQHVVCCTSSYLLQWFPNQQSAACTPDEQCFQTVNSASISLIIYSLSIQPGIVVITFDKIKTSRIESIHLPLFFFCSKSTTMSQNLLKKKKLTRKCAAIIMLNDILHGLNGNGKFDRHSDSNQGCLETCGKRRAERNSDHII